MAILGCWAREAESAERSHSGNRAAVRGHEHGMAMLRCWSGAAPPSPWDGAAERDLVARARSEPAAFGRLYRLHAPAILAHVRRRVGESHAAEDLVAEVFLCALAELPRYRDRGIPFRHWLYGIAARRVGRWARRQGRREVELDSDPVDPAAPDSVDVERVRRALLGLPPRFQSALTLFYFHDLDVEQIARVLRCRPGTVKSRLARGRALLARRLAPHTRGRS